MQEKIDEMKFFAKPKLGLDAVGGVASARLSSILAEVAAIPAVAMSRLLRQASTLNLACMYCSLPFYSDHIGIILPSLRTQLRRSVKDHLICM